MDLTRRVLLVDGESVALHARAFDILEYLVTCRDRAVTRDEIVRHVWRGVVVGENNLTVQIWTLRRVLAQHGGEDLIVTVPHRGYQFVDRPRAAELPAATPLVAAPEEARSDRRPRRLWPAAGAVLLAVVLIVAFFAWRYGPPMGLMQAGLAAPPFDPPPHSVAVLAFSNLSGEPAQEYLSDGLSEELIEALSQIRQIQVTARTSSFFFKGKAATIKDIAQALNVAAVVEGSVRRQGNRLRIEARLTDARTGFEVWSQPFDSDLGDMLKLESDIAAQVAGALQVKLTVEGAPDNSAGGTANAKALDLFLRGVQSIRHDSVQSYRIALASFDAAIEADPNLALAFAGRANALIMLGNIEDTAAPPSGKGWSDALSAANRGVKLAPGIGSTHIALANVLVNSLDLRGALAEGERAQALAPGEATVELLFSFVALSAGRFETAMQAALKATELDPLRPDVWLNLGEQYRIARNFGSAFEAYQHAQTLAGAETPLIAYARALAYLNVGNAQRALEVSLRGSDWMHLECRAIAQHALGRQRDAEQTFATLMKNDGYNLNYVYAEIFAQWGQPAEALRWLARAKEVNDSGLSTIKFDSLVDPIRHEADFKTVEKSLNFPD